MLGVETWNFTHQISNLRVEPSSSVRLWLMKAAPTVTLLLSSYWPLTYRSTRQDLPTPCTEYLSLVCMCQVKPEAGERRRVMGSSDLMLPLVRQLHSECCNLLVAWQ